MTGARKIFRSRSYLLCLLIAIYAFNNVDRLALGLLLQDMKVDLDLSDTQLGLLTGIAFSLFYSIMGVPIARWSDRGNRIRIIGITTIAWSGAVAMCGFVTNFVQLALVRVGVAIGEAGCVPPAHSLIAEHFSREERPRAVSRYMLGIPISLFVGFFFGGWLNEQFGWRITFILLGVPGLFLGALAWLTLRETRQSSTESNSSQSEAVSAKEAVAPPTLLAVFLFLWRQKAFRHLLFAFSVSSFFVAGLSQWKPSFFIRSYGLGTAELGFWLAVIYGAGGLVGTLAGGELAARFASRNERLQLGVMALVHAILGVASVFVYLPDNLAVSFTMMGLVLIGGAATNGPLFATIQTLVPEQMRATSVSLVYLSANLIGLGLGPLAVGYLSDVLRPHVGEESLRYALLAMCPGYFWCAFHLWRASKNTARNFAEN